MDESCPTGLHDNHDNARNSQERDQLEALFNVLCERPNALEAMLSSAQKIGDGTRASVYAINEDANYLLKIKHEDQAHLAQDPCSPLQLRINPNTLPCETMGQVVASLFNEVLNTEIEIVRKQTGTTYAMPYNDLFKHYDINLVLGEGQPIAFSAIEPYYKHYDTHLKTIATMPQAAFTDLVQSIKTLSAHGLYLDPCANNILVDTTKQRFLTLDHDEYIGPYQNLLGLSCALMDSMFVDLDWHATERLENYPLLALRPDLIAARRQILGKLLYACHQLHFSEAFEAFPINAFGYHQRSFDMHFILAICKIKPVHTENGWIALDAISDALTHTPSKKTTKRGLRNTA